MPGKSNLQFDLSDAPVSLGWLRSGSSELVWTGTILQYNDTSSSCNMIHLIGWCCLHEVHDTHHTVYNYKTVVQNYNFLFLFLHQLGINSATQLVPLWVINVLRPHLFTLASSVLLSLPSSWTSEWMMCLFFVSECSWVTAVCLNA